jgi:hypothetical protein
VMSISDFTTIPPLHMSKPWICFGCMGHPDLLNIRVTASFVNHYIVGNMILASSFMLCNWQHSYNKYTSIWFRRFRGDGLSCNKGFRLGPTLFYLNFQTLISFPWTITPSVRGLTIGPFGGLGDPGQ